MDFKDEEIKRLKKLVRELKIENDCLKSPLHLFDLMEELIGHYSILLNPEPKELRTTKGQRATYFKFDINDIVCVKSDGKTKWIYFNKPQISIDGIRYKSDKLSFTGSLVDFCAMYDQTQIHLCIISKSCAVNPSYYYIDKNRLKLNTSHNPGNSCNDLIISPKHSEDFTNRKMMLEQIISFQKKPFHSK